MNPLFGKWLKIYLIAVWWKKNKKVICFDLGGTNLRQAVIDFSYKKPTFLDFKKKRLPIFSQIRKELLIYAKQARNKYGIKKIAISSAGIVNKEKKKVFQAEQCYKKKSFDFDFLEESGFEVFLENDGKSFAKGNYFFGLKEKPRLLLSLTIGTGIGGGLIWSSKSFQGVHFSGMEVSKLIFSFRNGKIENWEDLSAGKGIERQYRELSTKKISTEEIFVLAEKGDRVALKVITKGMKNFSLGLANLINIFDPEVVILGGALVNNQKKYFQEAIKGSENLIFNKKIIPFNFKKHFKKNPKNDKIQVIFSSLGEKANLLGVGYEAIEKQDF